MNRLIALVLFSSLYSCNYPEHYFTSPLECENITQMVYDNDFYSLNEVTDILKASESTDFRYYFKTFLSKNGNEKIIVNFRNKKICMDVLLSIPNLGKLAGMKKTNGQSYPKELYDLQWKLKEQQGIFEAVYLDLHEIID